MLDPGKVDRGSGLSEDGSSLAGSDHQGTGSTVTGSQQSNYQMNMQAQDTLLDPPPPLKRIARQLMKTRYCKHFLRGYCRYEHKCAYAHQAEELMPKPDLVKTKICLNFLSGACLNPNCTYAHGLQEMRNARGSGTSTSGSSASGLVMHGAPVSSPPSYASGSSVSGDQTRQHVSQHDLVSPSLESILPAGLVSGLRAQARRREMVADNQISDGMQGLNSHGYQKQHGRQPPIPEAQSMWEQPQHLWHSKQDGELLETVLNKLTQIHSDASLQRINERREEELLMRYNEHRDARVQLVLTRWCSLALYLKKAQKMGLVLQYRWLSSCENANSLSLTDEARIAYLFLHDAKWVSMFPRLAHRCSLCLAKHIRLLWDEESAVVGGSKQPSVLPDSHFYVP